MVDRRFATILIVVLLVSVVTVASAQLPSDINPRYPPNYNTMAPPVSGGSYIDPTFGTVIHRMTDAFAEGATMLTPEYASSEVFNADETMVRIAGTQVSFYSTQAPFPLLRRRSLRAVSPSDFWWDTQDPNVLYHQPWENKLWAYHYDTDQDVVHHTFSQFSQIWSMGESNLSLDGSRLALYADYRYVFVYDFSSDSVVATLDTNAAPMNGKSIKDITMTPSGDGVIVGWNNPYGTGRAQGMEYFEIQGSNLVFQRQLWRARGHHEVGQATDGTDYFLMVDSATGSNGLFSVRISDGHRTEIGAFGVGFWHDVLLSSNSMHHDDYVYVSMYKQAEVSQAGWNYPWINELIRVPVLGGPIERIAHHRTRPTGGYYYSPRGSVSRSGRYFIYPSNFNRHALESGIPTDYVDTYLIDLDQFGGGQTQHLLSVNKSGTGTGTVISSPVGISCGSDCDELIDEGTAVALVATPAAGSLFAGWSGSADCTDGTLTMSAARTCTATFDLLPPPPQHMLAVTKTGTGAGTVTSNPLGIDCGGDCTEQYAEATVVALSATPAAGSQFMGWGGGADCSDGALTMVSARNCTAQFDLLPPTQYPLSVTKTGTGTGTVMSSPAGIDCGGDCTEQYDEATVVTLAATPAAGSQFMGWGGGADCTDGALTMVSARNCTAQFDLLPPTQYPLSVTKTGTGTGTVTSSPAGITCGGDCTEQYDEATVVALAATPAAGSQFMGWSGGTDCLDGTVTMGSARNCTAQFDLLPPPQYTLSVAKTGTGTGTVTTSPAGIDCGADCTEQFVEDTVVALAATPASGSQFAGWSGGADCLDGSVTMVSSRSCTAQFDLLPPNQYALSVTKTGTGTGTVTSSPAGIDCGADCSEQYDEATVVVLAATPASGSQFAGWSGGADCLDGSVTMVSSRSCTAQFDLLPPNQYALSVTKTGTGTGTVTSSPAGIDCGADCSEQYDEATVVALAAASASGSQFVGWSGSADCADGTVTMDASRVCAAQFDLLPPPQHVLSVTKTGTGTGTVTSSPAGIGCGADCSEQYDEATVVVLAATPAADSLFVGWSGGADCLDGSVTMTSARTCTAQFDLLPPPQYALSVTKTGTGAGTVTSSPAGIDCGADCTEQYDEHTVVALAATPAAGSQFMGWGGGADCTDGALTMVSARNCTAEFDLLPPPQYTLSVTKTGSGMGTVTSSPAGVDCGSDCDEQYVEDTVVALAVTPATGSQFMGWSGGADCLDGTVTMVSARSCTAQFDLLPPTQYSLSVTKTGTGTGTVTSSPAGIDCGADCTEQYDEATMVALAATPAADSQFVGWSGGADCTDGTVTMGGSTICTAQFDLLPPTKHTLSMVITGTGTGTVTSSPAGIDCGADCTEQYDEGTVVALAATPAAGSQFVGWGGGADCLDGSVTVLSSRSCTAQFDLSPTPQHLLLVFKTGSGSGTVSSNPAGIDCGGDCSEPFDEDTVVALTATPAADSLFAGWSGAADCIDGTVTMGQAQICTAQFELKTGLYRLTVSKKGSGSGIVTSSPGGIDCGANCDEPYTDGTYVVLTPTSAPGSSFVGWSGDVDCYDRAVTMNRELTCVAEFSGPPPAQYPLSVNKTGSGSGTVASSPIGILCGNDCLESYADGTVVSLSVTPATDSQFVGWSGGADCADGAVQISSAMSCTAQFDLLQPPLEHDLTVIVAGTGSGTVISTPGGIDCGADCDEQYADGTFVVLTPAPAAGSSFVGWSGDADCLDRVVTMTSDLTCIAEFSGPPLAQYTLSVSKTGAGSGTVTSNPGGILCGNDCLESYSDGSVVGLSAVPAVDSQFLGWSGDADCTDGTVTMVSAMSCIAQFDLLPQPQCTLTVTKTGTGSGTVTSYPGGIDCGADCDESYDDGTYVMLTPAAAAGSLFAGWSGDADCVDRAVTMIDDLSCVAEFTTQLGPAAPGQLLGSVIARKNVKLTWIDNASSEDEYRVERKEDTGGSFLLIASYPQNTTLFVDSNVKEAKTYIYRVLACKAGICSTPSNEATLTIPAFRLFGNTQE